MDYKRIGRGVHRRRARFTRRRWGQDLQVIGGVFAHEDRDTVKPDYFDTEPLTAQARGKPCYFNRSGFKA